MTQQSSDGGIFGLPFTEEDAKIIIQPIPWEVTTSYGGGTALAPQSILEASHQLDLFDINFKNAYQNGYYLKEVSQKLFEKNQALKTKAQKIIQKNELGQELTAKEHSDLEEINQSSSQLNQDIYQQTQEILKGEKFPALLGGDHSTPFGQIQAVMEKHPKASILHVDAHHDLRRAYQGFTHSHASIFYNVMESNWAPKKLVQVGIRDFCEEEYSYSQNDPRQVCFYDSQIQEKIFQGQSWQSLCEEIVSQLSDDVYISCDIDGLSPDFCPNTGTPVPGGLSYQQFVYLLKTLHTQKKRIIGFDLVEVAPDPKQVSEFDSNVGARILFQLCGWLIQTNHLSVNS